MKKLLSVAVLLVALCGTAHADVFANRQRPDTMRAVQGGGYPLEMNMPDPDTILAWITAMSQYAAPREGFFYDFKENEFANYFAATLFTVDPGISLSAGILNTDGYAVTVDYNIGQHIPSQGTPLLEFLQYLYVGGGVGQRHIDDEWQVAYGLDTQFKFTF